jgi:hypothetical protein
MSNHHEAEVSSSKRKLRPLIITMGGPRQTHMENLFAHPAMAEHFERPVFTNGVPSRGLRSRFGFLKAANDAGLLPEAEWKAIEQAQEEHLNDDHTDDGVPQFFECLADIPVTPGRIGVDHDTELHYSVELWRKAKGINRGRAVIGCTMAHLIAMRKCVTEGFDIILEDNVRAPPAECALRMREAALSCQEQTAASGTECHLRYMGWLGSLPNLQWIFQSYAKQEAFQRVSTDTSHPDHSTVAFPKTEDILRDLELAEEKSSEKGPEDLDSIDETEDRESSDAIKNIEGRGPGGTPVWGAFAYWVSKQGYEQVLEILRKDVGAMLWKGKRARYYKVKPIDKILPRRIGNHFGQAAVQIATKPTFFRAPMLTSKIHSQWDPEFCKSTDYQLKQIGLDWSDLFLTEAEQAIILHHDQRGEWITLRQLEELKLKEPGGESEEA